MEQALFKYLPSEIINNIFLRLPIPTIAISKCVCKSWLDFLDTDEFAKSHLSRSPAALSVLLSGVNSSRCTLYELKDDEIDVQSSHDHHYNRLTEFEFPHRVRVFGSANGFLFLGKKEPGTPNFDPLYVWNPITREYIELHCPQGSSTSRANYGFGASKITGQHKVVRIVVENSDCHVYTLGTRSWRRVECHVSFMHSLRNPAFLNGNLHWLIWDFDETPWISCFDLETECFSTCSASPAATKGIKYMKVSVLMDCLCLCDSTSRVGIIDNWLMKEYGVEKSWTKEYVINCNLDFNINGYIRLQLITNPIKVFEDGDILMEWFNHGLFYYSNKTETTSREFGDVFNGQWSLYIYSELLTPSFLSLKSFGMENVISLHEYDSSCKALIWMVFSFLLVLAFVCAITYSY